MANFRIYPGVWVTVNKTVRDLTAGQSYQVLGVPRMGAETITFCGIHGIFTLPELDLSLTQLPGVDDPDLIKLIQLTNIGCDARDILYAKFPNQYEPYVVDPANQLHIRLRIKKEST